MPYFIVRITADGYDTDKEEDEACKIILEEYCDSAAITCRVLAQLTDEQVTKYINPKQG